MNDNISDERLKEKLDNSETAADSFGLHGYREKSELFREDASAYRELIALRPAIERMEKALEHMIREWCEIVGDETFNSTPADTLEKARAALDSYRKAVSK